MSGPRRAIGFLTVLGGATEPSPAAVAWFPVVGAGFGFGLGLLWWTADRLWPAAVAAALVVVVDLAVTGFLHADGLVDSADGLLPHLDRDRRLEVMAAPDIGAFGVWVAISTFALRWAALVALRPNPFLLASLWCASRTAMAVTITWVPYAREEGLASAFGSQKNRGVLAIGLPLAVLLAGMWHGLAGLLAVIAGVGAAAMVVGLARRRVGGFTGDVLGAAGVMAETTGLVVAAAKWRSPRE